jgi:hypothetical protein
MATVSWAAPAPMYQFNMRWLFLLEQAGMKFTKKSTPIFLPITRSTSTNRASLASSIRTRIVDHLVKVIGSIVDSNSAKRAQVLGLELDTSYLNAGC